jgi:hypothetical protein
MPNFGKVGADFSYIFFRGKRFSAENSAEFLGKMIFWNFFRGKFQFFPTFFGKKFSQNFPWNFPRKNVWKIGPWIRFYETVSTVMLRVKTSSV